jgi:hypothetical protein
MADDWALRQTILYAEYTLRGPNFQTLHTNYTVPIQHIVCTKTNTFVYNISIKSLISNNL